MKPRPLPVSERRLARLIAWARLSLQALSAGFLVFMRLDPDQLDRVLNRAANVVAGLVFLRAAGRSCPPRPRSWIAPKARAGFGRALIGQRLRKKLSARCPYRRFFAILAMMRDLDAEADRLRRRLRCGLTRRRPLLPAPDSGKPQLCAPALAGAAAHDSS